MDNWIVYLTWERGVPLDTFKKPVELVDAEFEVLKEKYRK